MVLGPKSKSKIFNCFETIYQQACTGGSFCNACFKQLTTPCFASCINTNSNTNSCINTNIANEKKSIKLIGHSHQNKTTCPIVAQPNVQFTLSVLGVTSSVENKRFVCPIIYQALAVSGIQHKIVKAVLLSTPYDKSICLRISALSFGSFPKESLLGLDVSGMIAACFTKIS